MKLARYGLWAAWIVAVLATATSLTFSEIYHLVPCVLCWYQRICMFPLVVILGVGILRRDRHAYAYALPLAVIGLVIAGFHSLLQWGIISEAVSPCSATAACAIKQINWFGFITIPFMSFLAFAAVTVLLVLYARHVKADDL
jgi:disulfide bond formation protein DsbB